MYYEHYTLWSKYRVIAASDSQSICALRYAWATRKLHTICCLHERDFSLGLSRRWNRPRVSDHERERFLHRVAQKIIGIANRRCYLHGGDCSQTRSRQASLSLAAIAFENNRRRVSNTCDLRCRLFFARLNATIVLAHDYLHEIDFSVSRVTRQSRARVNSKSYAIYESPRHSAMHKCFASRWLRLSKFTS